MPDLFNAPPAVLAPLDAVLPEALHPTLREMAEEMYLHLVEDEEAVAALGLERLAELAVGQVDRVSSKLGGASFYLPKGVARKFSDRDIEIARRFNGRNQRQLAREYGLSDVRIDQIMKKWRQAEFARRQGNLPFAGEIRENAL